MISNLKSTRTFTAAIAADTTAKVAAIEVYAGISSSAMTFAVVRISAAPLEAGKGCLALACGEA